MDVPDLSPVAALGEFFALPTADDRAWLPISGLWVHEYTMRTRQATAAAFGVDEARIPVKAAASSLHLSIAARLLSPAVGAAVCLDAIPLLSADSVFWQPTSTHRPALAAADVRWVAATSPQKAAATITESLIATVLSPLNDALRQSVSLSPQVMWGNIASAANGAVTVLSQSRPDARDRGQALVRALLSTPPLTGAAEIVDGQFRRRNCCLFYQVPGGGYCGDCVLDG